MRAPSYQFLRSSVRRSISITDEGGKLKTLRQLIGDYVEAAILLAGGNLSEAARMLGLHRRTLQRMIKGPQKRRRRKA